MVMNLHTTKEMIVTKRQLPAGWSIRDDGEFFLLSGPYNEDMRERLSRIGTWDRGNRVWMVPVVKQSSLKRVLTNAAKAVGRPRLVRQEVSERIRWLGYVQEHAERGHVYAKGVAQLKALGIEQHPELLARMGAALQRAEQIAAREKR